MPSKPQQLKTQESVVLITTYSKRKQGNISPNAIRRIMTDFQH